MTDALNIDVEEVRHDVFLMALLRAYAEKLGLSEAELTSDFDPLATQLLLLLDLADDDHPPSGAVRTVTPH